MREKITKDFRTGDIVKYIPVQADGNPDHEGCHEGRVTHTKGRYHKQKNDERPDAENSAGSRA